MQKKSRFVAPLVFVAGLSAVLFGGSTPAVAQSNDFQRCLNRCRQINRDCTREADGHPGALAQCRNEFRICANLCEDLSD